MNAAANATFTKTVGSGLARRRVKPDPVPGVKTALGDGSSKISIQLSPPDLGKLDVKLTVSADGKTSGIMITASNNDTLNLLKQDTQGLTRALNDTGLNTDNGSLNFSLGGGQQNQGQANQQAALPYQQAQPGEEDAYRRYQYHLQELHRQCQYGGWPGYYDIKRRIMLR